MGLLLLVLVPLVEVLPLAVPPQMDLPLLLVLLPEPNIGDEEDPLFRLLRLAEASMAEETLLLRLLLPTVATLVVTLLQLLRLVTDGVVITRTTTGMGTGGMDTDVAIASGLGMLMK